MLSHSNNRVSGLNPKIMAAAAGVGVLEVIQYLSSLGYLRDQWTCYEAARGGHLQVLQWLRNPLVHALQGNVPCPWDKHACEFAAESGRLRVLQWMRLEAQPPCPWDIVDCAGSAAWGGHIEVLEWLFTVGGSNIRHKRICAFAARAGQLETLKWLRLKALCPWDERVCEFAAEYGHLGILQWARSVRLHGNQPCPWNWAACALAAYRGNFDILKWLRDRSIHGDQPCPWNEMACTNAAQKGHLEILQWLRDASIHNPCPWYRRDCLIQAQHRGHRRVVCWIMAQPD